MVHALEDRIERQHEAPSHARASLELPPDVHPDADQAAHREPSEGKAVAVDRMVVLGVGHDAAPAVSAIARSVREAAVLDRLVRTLVELCDGDEKRMLGPWNMALPLDALGLPGSIVQLDLSAAELTLRFRCGSEGALQLILPGLSRLEVELRGRLSPTLDVHAEAALC